MIERDKLTVIPDIKDPGKSTIRYKMGVDVAGNNYCDTLMEYLSDVNFIRPLTFEERERKLNERLYILENICKEAFYKLYGEL